MLYFQRIHLRPKKKKKVAHPLISLKQNMKSTEQLRFLMSEMKIVWEASGAVKNV